MTNMASNAPANSAAPKADAPTSEMKQIVLKEIGAKWEKFSQTDLSGLKGKDDLIAKITAKYGTEKAQAQRDVDALLKGRHF
jgi:hypothetical protein